MGVRIRHLTASWHEEPQAYHPSRAEVQRPPSPGCDLLHCCCCCRHLRWRGHRRWHGIRVWLPCANNAALTLYFLCSRPVNKETVFLCRLENVMVKASDCSCAGACAYHSFRLLSNLDCYGCLPETPQGPVAASLSPSPNLQHVHQWPLP